MFDVLINAEKCSFASDSEAVPNVQKFNGKNSTHRTGGAGNASPSDCAQPSKGKNISKRDHRVRFEPCEQRLVLSAQVLFDALGDQALQMHGAIDYQMGPLLPESTPIETHLREAHAQTGWNTLQQQFVLSGSGQTVAVIDTGIAWDHVALGKGYGAGYRVVGGWDFTEENDARPYDDGPIGFHGTHVAGIIGSSDRTHTGVAPDVDLVALRVFNDAGQGQVSWVERALQWVHTNRSAFENPITTVNLSLGTAWNSNSVPSWATLEEELRQLYEDGIVVTASAGNSFKTYNAPGLSYPAASQYVLPVSSVDENGKLSDFSQRSDRTLAAPGRNIVSTVPDHLLGRDGKVDDFATASGTSMAAPYVAGAAVLVREAMQMIGVGPIDAGSIIRHLHDTADSVFDSLTAASYDKLNLQRAIDELIPDDSIGDTASRASAINLDQKHLDSWINHLGDVDVYRFTAKASGQFTLDADSDWVDSLRWSVSSGSQTIDQGNLESKTFQLDANRTYELSFSANKEIGPYDFGWSFQANPSISLPQARVRDDLGPIDYLHATVDSGKALRAQATQDGVFTIQWNNPDSPSGTLVVRDGLGQSQSDRIWSDGMLRIDVSAKAGQWFDIQLPGVMGDSGELAIANVVSTNAGSLRLTGTNGGDSLKLNLSQGTEVTIGDVRYDFSNQLFSQIAIDGRGGNDILELVGSSESDKVDLRPGLTTISNSRVNATISGVEQVHYVGAGGADRVYLYDADTDDTLIARPKSAELQGIGYRFTVNEVDRLFVHASSGGQDVAYLYDSADDDRLSVRPQFTSMWGDGYFNSVRGFERVYAYGDAGGTDLADLYDSAGDDRFSTSGEAASIVGSGFFSYTRFFEQVRAHADAGGRNLATLYGASQQTEWQQGSDFIKFREAPWTREARGFETVQTYLAGQAHSLGVQSEHFVGASSTADLTSTAEQPSDQVSNFPLATDSGPQSMPVPMISGFTGSSFVGMRLPAVDISNSEFSTAWQVGSSDESSSRPTGVLPDNSLREIEGGLLAEILEMRSWLVEKVELPDDIFFNDPAEQRDILDAVFRTLGG